MMSRNDREQEHDTGNPAISSIADLQFLYNQVTSYDTHYSTARTAAVTVLTSVAILISREIWASSKTEMPEILAWLSLIPVALVLLFAWVVSSTLQWYTDACRMAHREIAWAMQNPASIPEGASKRVWKPSIVKRIKDPRDLILPRTKWSVEYQSFWLMTEDGKTAEKIQIPLEKLTPFPGFRGLNVFVACGALTLFFVDIFIVVVKYYFA